MSAEHSFQHVPFSCWEAFDVLMKNHIEKPVSFLPSPRDATQLAKLWVFSVAETIVGHVLFTG